MFDVRINGSLDVGISLVVVLWMPRGGMVRARGVVGGKIFPSSPLHIRHSFNMDARNQLVSLRVVREVDTAHVFEL